MVGSRWWERVLCAGNVKRVVSIDEKIFTQRRFLPSLHCEPACLPVWQVVAVMMVKLFANSKLPPCASELLFEWNLNIDSNATPNQTNHTFGATVRCFALMSSCAVQPFATVVDRTLLQGCLEIHLQKRDSLTPFLLTVCTCARSVCGCVAVLWLVKFQLKHIERKRKPRWVLREWAKTPRMVLPFARVVFVCLFLMLWL